jgi:hypothetical protein
LFLSRDPAKWGRLGKLSLEDSDEEAQTQDLRISEKILHPEHNLPARYNDIALFKLGMKVVFSAYSRPACPQVEKYFKDATGMAISYGQMDYGVYLSLR